MTKIWVVFRVDEQDFEQMTSPSIDVRARVPMQFQGVFSTRENADAACIDKHYFMWSATLDQSLPHELQEAPDGTWPRLTQ